MPNEDLIRKRIARFHERVDRSGGPDACWPWTGGTRDNGYGLAWSEDGKTVSAHRMAYRLAHGEVAEGLELDHLCHNTSGCVGGFDCPHRGCCNPAHMRPVTHLENQQSSPNIWKHGKRSKSRMEMPDRRKAEHSSLTPSQRTQRARIAARARWSQQDGADGTRAAREAFLARFERQVDPDNQLAPAERLRRAESAKREHFQRMAYARHKAS